jgi:cell division protein FtsI (penicillin-binding protein 3)
MVWGILMVFALCLALNLFRLQVLDADFLRDRALSQQILPIDQPMPRRSILDRNGNILAIDRPIYTLYAHPSLFDQDPIDIAQSLAPLLERSPSEILTQLKTQETGIRLADDLPEELADRITDLNLNGLELIASQERIYPQEDLFANVVGYVDVDRQGQAGLEFSLNAQLQLPPVEAEIRHTGLGSILPGTVPSDLTDPDDSYIQLTLDSRLQQTARTALRQAVQQFGAKRGGALVMDVNDGSILAMVVDPSYDSNQYFNTDVERFKNWLISDVYEPGSTFKPINVAIALENGAIKPDDIFYDEGYIEVAGWPIANFDYEDNGGRGMVSVTDILKDSSNVGMVHIMQRLDPKIYHRWLSKIGLGKPVGVDLPFETAGYLKSMQEFTQSAIEPATTAFGQGFSLTPIQLLQLHAMLANGGHLVTPHVVDGQYDDQHQRQWQPDRPVSRQLFSPETTKTVLGMMEVVVRDGTGKAAQISGYRIAGKTGTAQKANPNGGYLSGAKITSFVASFPVEAPRYIALAIVDEPKGADAFGSTVAAPVVHSMLEALIALEGIPPATTTAPADIPPNTP